MNPDLAAGGVQSRLARAFPELWFTSEATPKSYLFSGYLDGGESQTIAVDRRDDMATSYPRVKAFFTEWLGAPN